MITTYSVDEFLKWEADGSLKIRPEFQRRAVWTPKASKFFIDTLLRGFPSPLIYLRPRIDLKTKTGVREVVDGQQRLQAIIDFHNNQLRLDEQTAEFNGFTFEELDPLDQEHFRFYQLGVDELLSASDDYVLSVFQRINSFGLKLNSQELRHGKFVQGGVHKGGRYEGVFRQTVIDASRDWLYLWKEFKVVSLVGRQRMDDDQLVAQMLGVLLEGVCDGGQIYINHLYSEFDQGVPANAVERLNQTIQYIIDTFGHALSKSRLNGQPHFLMLFAAVAHALFGIPNGGMGTRVGEEHMLPLPDRDDRALSDTRIATNNLMRLGEIRRIPLEDVPPEFSAFRLASAGTVQRIKSRSVRFVHLYRALLPEAL